VTNYEIETSDGESYTSRTDPNTFITSNYSTSRNGKTTNESYGESIVNHRNELAQNLNNKKESSNNSNSSPDYGYNKSNCSVVDASIKHITSSANNALTDNL
jgi:hypothetical protein